MSQGSIKDMRKQLRNIVKESLNDTMVREMCDLTEKNLKTYLDKRLDAINKHLMTVLNSVESRSKDISSALLRSTQPLVPGIASPDDLT
jgi:cystathionine beta-lyase/cystathionine gamma-synthase